MTIVIDNGEHSEIVNISVLFMQLIVPQMQQLSANENLAKHYGVITALQNDSYLSSNDDKRSKFIPLIANKIRLEPIEFQT